MSKPPWTPRIAGLGGSELLKFSLLLAMTSFTFGWLDRKVVEPWAGRAGMASSSGRE